MSDRYDSVDYQMDEISTYLILRHNFMLQNEYILDIAKGIVEEKIDKNLYDYLCESGSSEEKNHIRNLFPLHPYNTAPAAPDIR